MPTEVNKEIELEIAYVPFIDIVSYSKLVTSEQRRLLELLNQIVRSRTFPRLPMQERFREHVIATWRESGGEPRRGGPIAGAACGQRFCDSFSPATRLLPAARSLHVALACHVHRNLSSPPHRNGANRSGIRQQSSRRPGERRKESQCADADAARAGNYRRKSCLNGSLMISD
jgi:hypothetical protein